MRTPDVSGPNAWDEDHFAEETLRYRRLIDHRPDMVCVHQGGWFVYVNLAGVRWLGGTSQEQFIGREITEFVHPDSIWSIFEHLASLCNAGDVSAPAEVVLRRLDGTSLQVESVSVRTVWEGKPAYQVIFRDLSAQKAAEETLRYQAVLVPTMSSDAVISTTFSGVVKSWNPAAETIYRRSAADALALQISEAVGAPLDLLAIVVDGGRLETTHYTSDGAVLAVRVSVAAMDKGFVLMVSDQTARRRVEQRYQTVVTSMDEGVVVLRDDGYVESANPAALRILGVDDPDCIYKPSEDAALFPVYPLCQPGLRHLLPDN